MFTFNLKKEWYEKFKSGEKNTEYRLCKDYWNKRISNLRIGQPCKLCLGYTKEYLYGNIKSITKMKKKDTDLRNFEEGEPDDLCWAIEFERVRGEFVINHSKAEEDYNLYCNLLEFGIM